MVALDDRRACAHRGLLLDVSREKSSIVDVALCGSGRRSRSHVALFRLRGLLLDRKPSTGNRGATWPDVYTTGHLPFTFSEVAFRMLVWLGGSFSTLSVILGWQLLYRQSVSQADANAATQTGAPRTLAGMAMGGLGAATVAGLVYILFVEASAKGLVFGNLGRIYLLGCALGIGLQCCCWIPAWRRDRLQVRGLSIATAGSLLTLVSTAVVREGVRISAIDLSSLAPLHAVAAKVGGFGVFLVASVVVSMLIALCIHLVRTGMIPPRSSVD